MCTPPKNFAFPPPQIIKRQFASPVGRLQSWSRNYARLDPCEFAVFCSSVATPKCSGRCECRNNFTSARESRSVPDLLNRKIHSALRNCNTPPCSNYLVGQHRSSESALAPLAPELIHDLLRRRDHLAGLIGLSESSSTIGGLLPGRLSRTRVACTLLPAQRRASSGTRKAAASQAPPPF